MDKEFLEKRLKKLNWTPYRLAKEICALRAEGGKVPPVTQYQSAVNKAVSEPRKSKLETIEELVQALGGTLTISWDDEPEESKIKLWSDVAVVLQEQARANNTTLEEWVNSLLQQSLFGSKEELPYIPATSIKGVLQKPILMMNLTPHWQQIRQSSADAHAALQWVAAAIYEQSEETVPRAPIDEVDLSKALELRFLSSDDGKVSFSDPAVRHDYLVRHAVDLAIATWDELEKFANLFDEIYRRSYRVTNNIDCRIGASVLLVLNYEYKKDIVGRVVEIARLEKSREKRDRSKGKIYDIFCDALSELDLKSESLVASLVDALELILQTSAGYKIYSIIENLAARSQNNADFLYHEFLARPESRIIELAVDALLGLAKLDQKEAHRRALVLTDSQQPTLRRIGIAALGKFKYDTSEQRELLRVTLDRLNELKTTFNVETDLVLLSAYGNLVNKSEKAAEVLVEFASCQNYAVREQLGNILFQKVSVASSRPWYKEAILRLVRGQSLSLEMLRDLDYCIEHYAQNDPDTALQVVEVIALGWDYSRNGEQTKFSEMLNSTFAELYNNNLNALNAAITRWFASKDKRLHLAGSDVIRFFNSIPVGESHEETTEVVRRKAAKNRVIMLSKEVLDTLDEQTVINVLSRLAGYITDIASLAALLLSAIKREPYSPGIASLIVEFESEYVLYNHPRDAGEYLKSRIKEDDITEAELNIIQEALNRSDAYFNERQKLPRLKELEPSSQQTYLLRLAKWKQQTAMMQEAERRSVFASILPKVRIKYGRGISYERDGEFTDPSPFAAFSYECELPQGEFIDPLGQFHQRLQWQNVGLQDKQNGTEDEITGETAV
ncbi:MULTISPECIES: hypothetical protein [Nostocales]|uniref:Uncharacterized protein n=3 Tax=Nostocales TaxID=1161 RepID=A0A0C1QRR5_9CYAN|nr:hypothetical protein [Tolypothrix bouteillei]KAF3890186.1 hypothetical protein DA73_0400035625 [Tolypothrix bouteillei VB521301]